MNRPAPAAIAALMVTLSTATQAGRIYGGLQIQNQSAPAGTALRIHCAGTDYNGTVRAHGRYSIDVSKQGPCTFSLPAYNGASTRIIAFREATRYNFLVTRSNGSYHLKRR